MSTSSLLEADVIQDLRDTAQQLRVDSVRCSDAASSGHPTSSMSATDLMAVLLARHLRYDFAAPAAPGNDHLIFSKGQASPLLYAMLRAAGAIGEEELLSYRKAGSRLEGHPTPRLPWVDVATGSLGQGLPIAMGVAIAGRAVAAGGHRYGRHRHRGGRTRGGARRLTEPFHPLATGRRLAWKMTCKKTSPDCRTPC
jgi:transketolase